MSLDLVRQREVVILLRGHNEDFKVTERVWTFLEYVPNTITYELGLL